MREQKLLWFLLALDLAFAGACAAVLFHINAKGKPVQAHLTNTTAPASTNQTLANAAPTETQPTAPEFSSDNVTSDEYRSYVQRLRSVGCPEARVRQVVLSDIDEFFARKRLHSALAFDFEWWREEPLEVPQHFLREKAAALDEERHALIQKLLGSTAPALDNPPVPQPRELVLTGPVLGGLPLEVQTKVQEICAATLDRMDAVIWSCAREKLPLNAIELARLREHARSELKQILTPTQLEEFLLRFSQSAQELREELRALGPTPNEFRSIFRAVDPLQHQLALEYGVIDALSKRQQDRFFEQREKAIREALGPLRYDLYLKSKHRQPTTDLISSRTER